MIGKFQNIHRSGTVLKVGRHLRMIFRPSLKVMGPSLKLQVMLFSYIFHFRMTLAFKEDPVTFKEGPKIVLKGHSTLRKLTGR